MNRQHPRTCNARFRADHVGSLLRPQRLLEARERFASGLIDQTQLEAIEDASILEAIQLQVDAGLDVVTDGEYRRSMFSEAGNKALEPFLIEVPPELAAAGPNPLIWKGAGADMLRGWPPSTGRRRGIGRKIDPLQIERLAARDAAFLRRNTTRPFKVTMPGVTQFALTSYQPGLTDTVYSSARELLMDLASVLRREIVGLIEDGASYIQLDSLRYVIFLSDPHRRQALIDAGRDPDEDLDLTIAVDNACLDGINRTNAVIGLHMCRGNNRSSYLAEGTYEAVAERAFSELQVDRFLLEYDDERAGGFDVLRFVPKDRIVVLGLISSKTAAVEPLEDLLKRVEEASRYLPVENLAISPQCGFASTAPGNLLSPDDQRRKLERVAEVARRVWG